MPLEQAILIFGASFVVGLSGAVTPGPLLAYNIREATRRGFWAGPYIATGHSLLELVVVVLLAVGLMRFIKEGHAFTVIAFLGALFLIWMGWGMVRNPGQGMPSIAGASHQFTTYNPTRPILGGIAVSLSNPYWSLWWATVGATFMNWSNSLGLGLLGLASFYFGHILADYAWYGLVSLGIASGRRFMTDAVYRGLILACGLFLWIMAGYFLYSGATRLL